MTPRPPTFDYSRRHLKFGYWALLVFLLFGLVLETLHGVKIPGYLDVGVAPRRLMWTLAHAHGTLVALVNVGFGLMAGRLQSPAVWIRRASPCLLSASILLPGGFFLGGVSVQGGDPNPGLLVVPVGGLLLAAGVLCAARAAGDSRSGG